MTLLVTLNSIKPIFLRGLHKILGMCLVILLTAQNVYAEDLNEILSVQDAIVEQDGWVIPVESTALTEADLYEPGENYTIAESDIQATTDECLRYDIIYDNDQYNALKSTMHVISMDWSVIGSKLQEQDFRINVWINKPRYRSMTLNEALELDDTTLQARFETTREELLNIQEFCEEDINFYWIETVPVLEYYLIFRQEHYSKIKELVNVKFYPVIMCALTNPELETLTIMSVNEIWRMPVELYCQSGMFEDGLEYSVINIALQQSDGKMLHRTGTEPRDTHQVVVKGEDSFIRIDIQEGDYSSYLLHSGKRNLKS